jgi:hypothetical protein
MRLARRDDAVAGVGYVEDASVYRVGGREREYCRLLRLKTFLDLWSGQIRPPVVEPAGWRLEFGQDKLRVRRQLE